MMVQEIRGDQSYFLASIRKGLVWEDFGERWSLLDGVVVPQSIATSRADERRKNAIERAQREEQAELERTQVLAKAARPANWPELGAEKGERSVKLFAKEEIEAGAARMLAGGPDRDLKDRVTAVRNALRESGEFRSLEWPTLQWRARLEALTERFPNFEEVIAVYSGHCALAELKQTAPYFPPILLNGPPGVGKTYFAGQLADLLGTQCIRIGFDIAQNNDALCGSSSFWSNAHPGEIFSALVYGSHANPVVLIDEVEKASARYYEPVNALLSLLEPVSAARFTDLCFPWITIDARHITWICCSNDGDLLPAPVLSRLVRFDVPPLSHLQIRRMVCSLFKELLTELPEGAQDIELREDASDLLCKTSPRAIRQELLRALALVILQKRKVIRGEDIKMARSQDRNPIGFVHDVR